MRRNNQVYKKDRNSWYLTVLQIIMIMIMIMIMITYQ